jgi:hypothetical protein
VRKILPAFAALAFATAFATPLPAQFAATAQSGKSGLSSTVPTVGLPQMLPKMNMAGAMTSPLGGSANPFGGTKTFSFQKMLPSFSWMKQSFFPLRTPTPQYPVGGTLKK